MKQSIRSEIRIYLEMGFTYEEIVRLGYDAEEVKNVMSVLIRERLTGPRIRHGGLSDVPKKT